MDMHAADARRPAHEAALRAVQKPPAKPWRSLSLGGARARGAQSVPRRAQGVQGPRAEAYGRPRAAAAKAALAPAQPVPVRPAVDEAQLYAPWFGFPMPMAASLDAAHGALI
ncbi:hypothetical protein OsJ_36989 [Oryza sativa Japonica Group]|uniref:Uncharacterized protein n=1 Tax=Oryza sativa subsp. japonica TaxID=39947 RepID=B9GEF8_ORYSJ|nr:hypothetical protein OsJ_36989 [Oryza sativa Japonica Group]